MTTQPNRFGELSFRNPSIDCRTPKTSSILDLLNANEAGRPVRFHAAFDLDPERLNRDFGKVSAEVISHLTGLLGTDVRITIEIEASNGEGFPDTVVRNVTENARTLRFDDYGFEER